MGKKKLTVRISYSYEPNRLAELYLLDAYKKLALDKQVNGIQKEKIFECNNRINLRGSNDNC